MFRRDEAFWRKYDFVELLGTGAFGRVVLIKDRKTDALFALKILRYEGFSPKEIDLGLVLSREPFYARQLVQYLEAVTIPVEGDEVMGPPLEKEAGIYTFFRAIRMEYIRGPTLRQLIATKKDLSEEQIATITISCLRGLAHLHLFAKLAHRDIKPDNIALRVDGTAVLLDFGLSCGTSKALALGSARMDALRAEYFCPEERVQGTGKYFSPFVLRKLVASNWHWDLSADPDYQKTTFQKMDVWALGLTLYALIKHKSLPRANPSAGDIIALRDADIQIENKAVKLMLSVSDEARPSASVLLRMVMAPALKRKAAAILQEQPRATRRNVSGRGPSSIIPDFSSLLL